MGLIYVNPLPNAGRAITLECAFEEHQFRIQNMVKDIYIYIEVVAQSLTYIRDSGRLQLIPSVYRKKYPSSTPPPPARRPLLNTDRVESGAVHAPPLVLGGKGWPLCLPLRLALGYRACRQSMMTVLASYLWCSAPKQSASTAVVDFPVGFIYFAFCIEPRSRTDRQVDPATGKHLHELEHEVRCVTHPAYPVGRDVSANA